jgi:uncharacterized protein (TIGR03435 family)
MAMTSLFHLLPLLAVVVAAQSPTPTFEVASVKPNKSGTLQSSTRMLPNGIEIMIQLFFQINQPSKLIGMPDWPATERFDISARAAGTITAEERRLMMQALITERFKLVARREKREVPVLALMLNRADGKLGPNLIESKGCIDARDAAAQEAKPPAERLPVCGPQAGGAGRLILKGSPMQLFTSVLALVVGGTVTDKTGLTGRYDLDLKFTPERQFPGAEPPAPDPNAPSIYTAVKEQLGLKLEPQKVLEEVLVIDHIERPTEN